MVKKGILGIILLFFLSAPVLAAGSKEKELLVPSDSGWVLGMDLVKIRESATGSRIINDILPVMFSGSTGKSQNLDSFLEKEWGIRQEQAAAITVFGAGDTPDPDKAGAIIQLQNTTGSEVLDTVKARKAYTAVAYKKAEYFRFGDKRTPFFLFAYKNKLLVAPDTVIMEKLLDVLGNADDISRNKKLEKLIRQYRKEMCYLTGFIPAEYIETENPLLSEIIHFGLSVNFAETIALKLMLECTDSKKADNIATLIKLSLSMAEKSIPRQNENLKGVVRQLFRPVTVQSSGKQVAAEALYTEKDLEMLARILPVLIGPQGM